MCRFWGSFIDSFQKASKISKPLWRFRSCCGTLLQPRCNNEGLRDTGNRISRELSKNKSFFGEPAVATVSYLVHYDTLLVVCIYAEASPLCTSRKQILNLVYHDPLITYFLYFLAFIFKQNQIKTPHILSRKQ